MNALALNFVQGENDAQLSERLPGAPGEVDESRVSAVHDIHIMVAGHKIEAAANPGVFPKKVEELRPLGPRAGIRNVSRQEDSSERRLRLYRRQPAQRLANAFIALRALQTGFHAVIVAASHNVQIGEVGDVHGRAVSAGAAGIPVENRVVQSEFAPEPI